MHIPTVSVFAPTLITSLTIDAMRQGIERRMTILTYLFCPEKEIEPEKILKDLKMEDAGNNEVKMRWRPRMRYPPRAYKFGNELREQLEMARFGLRSYPADSVKEATHILESSVDGVGFFQGYGRDDMGWPVVMAAAASIVDQAGGAIVTNGYGWFVPSGNEVDWLFDPQLDDTA